MADGKFQSGHKFLNWKWRAIMVVTGFYADAISVYVTRQVTPPDGPFVLTTANGKAKSKLINFLQIIVVQVVFINERFR